MRQKDGGHVLILEARDLGELETGHLAYHLHHILADMVGELAHPGTHERTVAYIEDLVWIHFREQSHSHGAVEIDKGAETACQDNLFQVTYLQSNLFEQGGDSCENGTFCPDEIIDVYLVDHDVVVGRTFILPGQHVFPAVLTFPDAGIVDDIEFSTLIQHPLFKEGGHDDEETGSTYP